MSAYSARFLEPLTFTDLSPRTLSAECEEWLAAYKEGFLAALKEESGAMPPPALLQHALNEADSLAALTPFPTLFLPVLIEEKVTAAKAWAERQRRLLGGPEISLAA